MYNFLSLSLYIVYNLFFYFTIFLYMTTYLFQFFSLSIFLTLTDTREKAVYQNKFKPAKMTILHTHTYTLSLTSLLKHNQYPHKHKHTHYHTHTQTLTCRQTDGRWGQEVRGEGNQIPDTGYSLCLCSMSVCV